MAVFPCDFSRHRYRTAQQSLYYTEISEHLISTYKIRLCPQHFDEVTGFIAQHFSGVEDNSIAPDKCELCTGDRHFTVQARVYPKGKTDEQFIIELCAACASQVGNQLHVYNGERLAAR